MSLQLLQHSFSRFRASCSLSPLFYTSLRIRNIYPVLAGLDSKLPRLLVIAIVVLHAAIALTFKIVFFS